MKGKKATAGQKIIWKCWFVDDTDLVARQAIQLIDRAIARERRKERRDIVADLVSCFNCLSGGERAFLAGIIDRVREGGQR